MTDQCMNCECFYIHNGQPTCEIDMIEQLRDDEDCLYFESREHLIKSADAYLITRSRDCPEEENTFAYPMYDSSFEHCSIWNNKEYKHDA